MGQHARRSHPVRNEDRDAIAFRSRLLDAVDAAVVILDPRGHVMSWNSGAELLYGWTRDEALGRHAIALLSPDEDRAEQIGASMNDTGRWEGELELQRRDGSRFIAHVRNARIGGHDDEHEGFVGLAVDITGQRQAEQELRSARDYMRAVADSIGDGICTVDELGRIVYLNPRAEQMLGWSAEELAGRELHPTLHFLNPDGSPSSEEDCPLALARREGRAALVEDDVLVRRNGMLLPVRQVLTPFEAADGVGGFVLVFSDISERKRQERDAEARLHDLGWIERIRDAMRRDRFVLHAQPIVEIASGRTVQHELLIRMVDEDATLIAPGAFLPVAENYGLIGEIDRWVVLQGIAYAARGHAVELNMSAHSLGDPTFCEFVSAQLRQTGADPELVVFEITETALLHDEAAALRFVEAMREHGCGIALDDFGTGYGGFSYVKRLPLTFLKIDIEFVRDLTREIASRQVVQAVVGLARGLGLKTVAEGVEDLETLALLGDLGVDYGQGFAIGVPAPVTATFGEVRSFEVG